MVNKVLRENNNMLSSEWAVDISTVTQSSSEFYKVKMVSVLELVGIYDTLRLK